MAAKVREPRSMQSGRASGLETGVIFDIERHALHDGPGIRTLVFLKGCTLRCRWCSNPEGQSIRPEVLFYDQRCTGCGRCVDACPHGAIIPGGPHPRTDRSRCTGCGSCVAVCPVSARVLAGKTLRADQVLDIVLKDEVFYRHSAGGITVSGGEPLAQLQFLHDLLSGCKEYGIHTAVETAGHVSWETFERILPVTDLFLYDLKHMDEEKHLGSTGASNRQILQNLAKLASRGVEIIVRVPVVPQYNFSLAELEAIFTFVRSLSSIRELHLLPYHSLGASKYRALDREYGLTRDQPEDMAAMLRQAASLPTGDLRVRVEE